MRTMVVALTIAASTVLGAGPVMASTPPPSTVATTSRPATATAVEVAGDVKNPTTYTPEQLSALAQITVTTTHGTVSGVSLQSLVNLAGPNLDNGKNPQLRVTASVTGRFGQKVTFALGELDTGFGNHPALLVTDPWHSTTLLVPGDQTPFRTVLRVSSIQVVVSIVPTVTTVAAGAIQVNAGHRTVTLPASVLARLPQRTETVSFMAGTTLQQHTETGPSLNAVLLAARILPLPNAAVTAIGSDGYAADVTIGETLFGGRPLLLSLVEDNVPLTQPRLVPDGDIKGGRYVSGVVALTVDTPRW